MHRRNTQSSLRTAVIAGTAMTAAIALLAGSVSAEARTNDLQQRHPFQIPSEDLSAALTAFSSASQLHVVASDIPSGMLSPGVDGNVSTASALSTLLRGTGMSFRQVDAETIVVAPAQSAQLRATQYGLSSDALADQPTAAAAPAAGAPDQGLNEVQVTGTRIVRQGYEAPTPVTAVGLADLQNSQQPNIGETLNQLPVFQGSVTGMTSSTGSEGSQTELNLRNLGAQRNLILFDGRRLPTGNTEGVPDIAMVPDALIQRVDVVTGGASAVYGSDAVAGVVNFVLDTNFTGIKGEIQGGISGYGDGPSSKVSLSMGTTFFGGRLHMLLSGDWSYQAAIDGNARTWNVNGENYINNPAYKNGSNVPQFLWEPCCVGLTYPAGGVILAGPLQGTAFGTGGTPYQWNYGYGLTAAGQLDYGGDWQEGNIWASDHILPAATDVHAFARLGFDITPTTQVFAEFVLGDDHQNNECCPNYYQTGVGPEPLYTSNPYIPAQTLAAATAANVTSFTLGDVLRFAPGQSGDWGTIGQNHYRTTDIYVLGFKGQLQLGKDSYNWNVYGQQGIDTELHYDGPESNKILLDNALQAVRVGTYGANSTYTDNNGKTLNGYNAANYPNPLNIPVGSITCLSNLLPLNNVNETTNCVPMNVFGSFPCKNSALAQQCVIASQASINYTQASSTWRQVGTQSILGADISGEPFSDWAGPVSVALDAEYRREAAQGFTDIPSSQIDYFSTNYFAFYGAQHVEEGALEVVVPLLKGLPFVQELDANAAARATEYSTSGYVTTYKYGFEYTPINDIRLRGVYSEDIRQPNLFDLYGYSVGHGTTVDPFNGNVAAPSYTISAGNPKLQPEKAHQYELGLVFQPSEVPGLNLSVDFWHINITGAIATPFTSATELQSCLATRIPGTFTGTSPLCQYIARTPCSPCPGTNGEAAGSLYSTETIPFNVASKLAEGVDYSGDYRKNLTEIVSSWKGALDLHISMTNSIHNITNSGVPGATQVLESVGFGATPRWAGIGTLTYDLDPWRISLTEKYDSATWGSNTYIYCPTNCPTTIPSGFTTVNIAPRLPAYFISNLAVNYKFIEGEGHQAEAFMNVSNLLNRQPHWGETVTSGFFAHNDGNIPYYDTIGVYARLGVRFRL